MLVNSDIRSKNTPYSGSLKEFNLRPSYKNTKVSIRVNSKGELFLKNKKLLRKDYFESIKMPNEEDSLNYNQVHNLTGLECKDIPSFFLGWNSLKELIIGFIQSEKKEVSLKKKEEKEWNDLLKNQVYKRIAQDIFYMGEVKLGSYSLEEVYLSKNHRYYEEGLGLWANLETWGILGGKTAIINIKGVKSRDFQKIKEAFKKERGSFFIKNNQFLKPIYYEAQAHLLCTGMQKSLIHLINLQEREESLTFLIKAEEETLSEISFFVEKFNNVVQIIKNKFKKEGTFSSTLVEPLLKNEWFSLSFPSPKDEKKYLSSLNA